LEFPNTNTHNTMPYNNFVSLEYAINQLDLFDNIKFKYLKYLFNKNTDFEEWGFEVDIEDIEDPELRDWMCKTVVSFDLDNPDFIEELGYNQNEEKYITFTKEYVYNGSSPCAINFMNLYFEDEEEESEEE